jgi:hypothetical protein
MKSQFALAMGAAAALSTILLAIAGIELPSAPARAAPPAAARVSFAEDILPLLKFKCGACHLPGGEGAEKSGFEVSSYETVMKGTKYGAVVVAGDPDVSSLMRLLDWRVAPEIRMPHGKTKLSVCDRDLIRTWIFEGAKDN